MSECEINFRPNGNSAACVREGWGESEPFGRWMVGERSQLILPPPPWGGAFRGSAVIGPYLLPGHVDEQKLTIVINGVTVLSIVLTQVLTVAFDIPDGLIGPKSPIEIVCVHEGARAPASLIPGEDLRALAVSIWSLTLLGPARPAGLIRPPRTGPPVWEMRARGNLANRMIEYMVARAVQARVPECVLTGVELDEWGLSAAHPAPFWADHAVLDEQFVDIEAMADLLRQPDTGKIVHCGYGQRMANFPPLEACREMFRPVTDNVTIYDSRYLLINVRGGEIVSGTVPFYVLIPPNFYRDLIARTGLIPVFMGQLEPNPYTDMLRAAFPAARFVMSQGPMRDFETIRRAAHVVVAVSTFSWLAAWLSHATTIHLPVNGLFQPLHCPDMDLLPIDDARYEFHLFPVNHAVPPDRLPATFAALDGTWRRVGSGELKTLRQTAPACAAAA